MSEQLTTEENLLASWACHVMSLAIDLPRGWGSHLVEASVKLQEEAGGMLALRQPADWPGKTIDPAFMQVEMFVPSKRARWEEEIRAKIQREWLKGVNEHGHEHVDCFGRLLATPLVPDEPGAIKHACLQQHGTYAPSQLWLLQDQAAHPGQQVICSEHAWQNAQPVKTTAGRHLGWTLQDLRAQQVTVPDALYTSKVKTGADREEVKNYLLTKPG